MNKKRKILIFSILTLLVLALGGIATYYWYNSAYYVSTEDARVTGDLVKISPQISAKLLEFDIEEGDMIAKDQILGRQEMVNLSDSSIEQSLIRAPISGIIIKKQGNISEFLTAGQTIGMVVDPGKLYISANIEETRVEKLKKGEKVEITIDQYAGEKFSGEVISIGQASNSTFSLLPSSTSGTFTKVEQKIPVKISIDKTDRNLLPGTNAVVKIHIK